MGAIQGYRRPDFRLRGRGFFVIKPILLHPNHSRRIQSTNVAYAVPKPLHQIHANDPSLILRKSLQHFCNASL